MPSEEKPSTYSSGHDTFHQQLDEILSSGVKDIRDAIQMNLRSLKLTAQLVKNLASSGEYPTEKELAIIRKVLDIPRAQGKMELQQKLLMDLVQQASSGSEPTEFHRPAKQISSTTTRKKKDRSIK